MTMGEFERIEHIVGDIRNQRRRIEEIERAIKDLKAKKETVGPMTISAWDEGDRKILAHIEDVDTIIAVFEDLLVVARSDLEGFEKELEKI